MSSVTLEKLPANQYKVSSKVTNKTHRSRRSVKLGNCNYLMSFRSATLMTFMKISEGNSNRIPRGFASGRVSTYYSNPIFMVEYSLRNHGILYERYLSGIITFDFFYYTEIFHILKYWLTKLWRTFLGFSCWNSNTFYIILFICWAKSFRVFFLFFLGFTKNKPQIFWP